MIFFFKKQICPLCKGSNIKLIKHGAKQHCEDCHIDLVSYLKHHLQNRILNIFFFIELVLTCFVIALLWKGHIKTSDFHSFANIVYFILIPIHTFLIFYRERFYGLRLCNTSIKK